MNKLPDNMIEPIEDNADELLQIIREKDGDPFVIHYIFDFLERFYIEAYNDGYNEGYEESESDYENLYT